MWFWGVRPGAKARDADIVCKSGNLRGEVRDAVRRTMQTMSDEGRNMTHESTEYNLSLELEYAEFDPLEDLEPEAGTEEDQTSAFPTAVAAAENTPAPIAPTAIDTRTAEERTADLLQAMAPRRTVLLNVLSFCQEPQPVAQVNQLVDKLQENNASVYTAANLCSLLEKSGALDRITADGSPADSIESEPRVVVVDGVEYLEAGQPIETFWRTTDAGAAAVEADKPLERLRELLDSDAAYRPIYKRVLSLCAAENGATTKSLGEAVDNDPLVQKPRFYVAHFIDRLEKCDALAWHASWVTTDIGRTGLEMLAGIDDQPAIAANSSEEE